MRLKQERNRENVQHKKTTWIITRKHNKCQWNEMKSWEKKLNFNVKTFLSTDGLRILLTPKHILTIKKIKACRYDIFPEHLSPSICTWPLNPRVVAQLGSCWGTCEHPSAVSLHPRLVYCRGLWAQQETRSSQRASTEVQVHTKTQR